MSEDGQMIYDENSIIDLLGDEEHLRETQSGKNYAKVGSSRGTTLLYTYGPGSVMDLPHFTVMPMGLESWNRIWERRITLPPTIHAPRLLDTVQLMLGRQVKELRPFPHESASSRGPSIGRDLGVPAMVFPQWLRCTRCKLLAPLSKFTYANANPYRPDQAQFTHTGGKCRKSPCIPARYLLVCPDGHVDEFPYSWWVHRGGKCPAAEYPVLHMVENLTGLSGSGIRCDSCKAYRSMGEAQSTDAADKLPKCRGRFPHLGAFAHQGCEKQTRLMLIGASNLWFPVTQSIIDMPLLDEKAHGQALYDNLVASLGPSDWMLEEPGDNIKSIKKTIEHSGRARPELLGVSDEVLLKVIEDHLNEETAAQESEEERLKRKENWDPVDLLVPEWKYLQQPFAAGRFEDKESGLVVSEQQVSDDVKQTGVARVFAMNRLRKVNALLGFTRIDDFDRANDPGIRLVKLTRDGKPTWIPATEDRGEGVFIQFDEEKVAGWEQKVLDSDLWKTHKEAHRRNWLNRQSDTARDVDPDTKLPQPRYWLVHTFAHALIKRMAMSAGYSIPSLSERIYAWQENEEMDRPPAAGVLIVTTASDSDGTLGGLVSLSEPERFAKIMMDALREMTRCSSDPVCAGRIPKDPEDFLHGAACHCCCMLSETSCERANRFLDRRFIVPLPGDYAGLSFFG